jgi:type II secretory pathway predicted ATPase ExeA
MTVDHLHHFGLAEDPFRNDHHEKFLVEMPSQTVALCRLDRGVRDAKGLTVLVGGAGVGKTQIARKLYEDLEEEVFEASMMVVLRGSADSDWLLTRFANQLGVEEPASEREALIGQIYERLAIIREDGRHAVLIIDDAQGLASKETLTEVCGLVKLEYEDRRVLSIVLAGGPALEREIGSDPMLAHHVDIRVKLSPFERQETAEYVGRRIQLAGGNPQIVLPEAVASLHELSEGAPGRINTLLGNALFEAFLAGRTQVARSDVEGAHADLGWDALGAAPSAPTDPLESNDSPVPAAAAARLDPKPPLSRGGPSAEATQVLSDAPPVAPSEVADLDSQLEAAFEGAAPDPVLSNPADAGQTMLMDFDAAAPAAVRAVPARAAAAPTEIQLEPQDALEAPPKEEGDEVDDLFMELLDE